jgi:hypothetical protein
MVYTFLHYVFTPSQSAPTGRKCRVEAETPQDAATILFLKCTRENPEALHVEEEFLIFPEGRESCFAWVWDENLKRRFPEA